MLKVAMFYVDPSLIPTHRRHVPCKYNHGMSFEAMELDHEARFGRFQDRSS